MPSAFNFTASPFDCLTPQEQGLVRNSVDVAYFPEGEVILEVGARPSHLFIIIKGYVQQRDDNDVVGTGREDRACRRLHWRRGDAVERGLLVHRCLATIVIAEVTTTPANKPATAPHTVPHRKPVM